MERQRTFVFGDIHGCLTPLRKLVDRIGWAPHSDRLIFVGDFIDRGPDSRDVVDFIIELQGLSARVEGVMGNHEAMLLDYLHGKNRDLYIMNGGGSTLAGYGAKGEGNAPRIPDDHLAFFNSLPYLIEMDEFFVVHAGFRPGVAVKEQSRHDMVWIREPFIYSEADFGKRVLFGHTPFHEPFEMDNKIGLDTGAVYGNRLTCLELPEMTFHSVRA